MTHSNLFLIARVAVGAESGHSGAGSLPVIIGTAVVIVIVLRRMRGRELRPRRLLTLPLIVLIVGAGAALPQMATTHLHGLDYLIAAIDLVLSIGLGAARGFTVQIYRNTGTFFYRYGRATVLLWCLSIGLRFMLGIFGSLHGASPLVASGSVILMLGLTLLCQNVIVRCRQGSPSQQAAAPRAQSVSASTDMGSSPMPISRDQDHQPRR
jgi:hypothetical protein